jgi:feruloyl esterase
VGRSVTAAYYGEQAGHSYFIGCSDGGRESLMEAQRYPLDFDGYLVGAPGIDIPRNELTHVHVARQLAALGPAQALTPAVLQTLSQGVLQKCDALDGLKDGVLRDPRQCRFDPHELVCKPGSNSACLSSAQADAIQAMHTGPRDPKTGRQIAPGTWGTLGAESATWLGILLAPPGAPALIDLANKGIISELLYENPDLNLATLDLVQAEADIARKLAPIINSDNPDLRMARQNGRKILHFHGWADPNISPQYSLDYFEAVQRKLGGDTGDFYRLFMVPGMAHCVGGVGPVDVALAGAPNADPERDWVGALERWVEQGIAPQRIVAAELPVTRGPPGATGAPGAGVGLRRTRPVCPYPRVAVHDGKGGVDDAASFQCEVPPQ